jgi:hypothetical protein
MISQPKEEHRLVLFENRILREICAEERKEIRIERIPQRRRTKWAEHLVQIEELRNP